MKRIIQTASLFLIWAIQPPVCYAQPLLTRAQWLEDLSVLEKSVYERHVNPFWKNSKSTYEAVFSSLRNKINNTDEDKLQPELITTGFAQILALTGDGHSGVSSKSRAELFGLYNYNVSWFPEGLFVVRTNEDNKEILGSRIIKIDEMPVDEIKKRVASVSTSFQEQGFKRFSPRYLESPGVLFGLGISKSPQQVTLTVQNINGIVSAITYKKVSQKDQEKTKFVTLSDITSYPLPLSRRNLRKNYWFEYLPENRVLYVNYIAAQNSKEESMEAFSKRIRQTLEKESVDKFVIDIRYNSGGDQFTAWPLLSLILSEPAINQPGKLFVITGANTFSAATAFLEALETNTDCIIAGTPPADSPIYPAEDKVVVLPNCKMEVRLSAEMWNYSVDDDQRILIEPDITVVTEFNDYIKGRDPALEAILNYKITQPNNMVSSPETFTGRYSFSMGKTLEVTNANGILKATVKGRLRTVLTPAGENRFSTGIKNFFLKFSNGQLIFQYPDGNEKVCRKLGNDELTAFDLLLAGRKEEALKAYLDLKHQFPDNMHINGANLAGLAFYYLVETMDFTTATALLEIALKLDPHSEVAKGFANGLKQFSVK